MGCGVPSRGSLTSSPPQVGGDFACTDSDLSLTFPEGGGAAGPVLGSFVQPWRQVSHASGLDRCHRAWVPLWVFSALANAAVSWPHPDLLFCNLRWPN